MSKSDLLVIVTFENSGQNFQIGVISLGREHALSYSLIVSLTGNGTMEFGEFMALVSTKLEAVDVCEEILEAFRVFDKKGSGRMSKSELRSIIVTLGEKVDEDEADYMLAETDGDRDEMINYCSELDSHHEKMPI